MIEIARSVEGTDKYCHWDYALDLGAGLVKVDVKGMKSFSRGEHPQDQYLCVELHGNHPMNSGWLFGGLANIIAFEMYKGFLLVDRKVLCTYVNKVVKRIAVTTSREAILKVYNRQGAELISWLPLDQNFYQYPNLVYAAWI